MNKWTKEEESMLIKCIKENPTNIKKATQKASEKLPNRTENACMLRWYKVLSKQPNLVAYCLVSNTKYNINRKTKVEGNHMKASLWSKFKQLIVNLLG